MDNSLYLVAAALNTATREQQRIATNVANSTTPGFKEVLAQVQGRGDRSAAVFPYQQIRTDWQQGAVEPGGNHLDIALSGAGFLVIEPSGQNERRYWRGGHINVSSAGYLLTSSGAKIIGNNGAIQIDPTRAGDLAIDSRGKLWLGQRQIDQLQLVNFAEPQKLIAQGGSYANPMKLPEQQSDCRVCQGYLEKSNATTTTAMVAMIENMRYYESMQRITNTLDQGWQGLLEI